MIPPLSSEEVRDHAFSMGFDGCRITTSAPPSTGPWLDRALEEGRHAGMAWLARTAEKRKDPSRVLADVRSIIVLATSYAGPDDVGWRGSGPGPGPRGGGVVSRYARHADYHDVLKPRLEELTRWLDRRGGLSARSLWYVDTGPILERDLGQRAGLGFIGKHTNLISRQLGNWFLLSEILTPLELEPDPPEMNHCGKCTRCLEACPTGALPAPFTLDARRCIAYLTIEHRGPIPEAMRPLIGDRVFGCDDCLEVCPWNRFARESNILREHRRPELASPDLLGWLDLDEASFRRLFAGTPMLRAKWQGFRRNVCVVLGNAGDARALPALARAMSDPDAVVAEHAAWAAAQVVHRQEHHGHPTAGGP
jgi:epoxyqueuosine reductase